MVLADSVAVSDTRGDFLEFPRQDSGVRFLAPPSASGEGGDTSPLGGLLRSNRALPHGKRTPQELLAILRDERELAKRLKDTEHAAAIYPDAGPQRGGMIATLNSVSNALKLLPRKEEAKTSWTALEWAQRRQGWLFITSPPEFRERLWPLISMWLGHAGAAHDEPGPARTAPGVADPR